MHKATKDQGKEDNNGWSQFFYKSLPASHFTKHILHPSEGRRVDLKEYKTKGKWAHLLETIVLTVLLSQRT